MLAIMWMLLRKLWPILALLGVLGVIAVQHRMITSRDDKINELEAQLILEQRNQRTLAQECEAREQALSEELARQRASARRAAKAREGAKHVEGDTAGSRADRVLDLLRGSQD